MLRCAKMFDNTELATYCIPEIILLILGYALLRTMAAHIFVLCLQPTSS